MGVVWAWVLPPTFAAGDGQELPGGAVKAFFPRPAGHGAQRDTVTDSMRLCLSLPGTGHRALLKKSIN